MYSTQCVGPISPHLNFRPSASQLLLPQQFPYTYQPSYPYMSSLGPSPTLLLPSSALQQVHSLPPQFQPTHSQRYSYPMQQNHPNPFSISLTSSLSRFPSGVSDGEAHLPANAAASSVRPPAPQPANLPFQGQGVQRTPTQSQFAGIPSITATDQPQPPSQYESPTVRESSSQQAKYFPSQFQATYPYQHSFPMQ